MRRGKYASVDLMGRSKGFTGTQAQTYKEVRQGTLGNVQSGAGKTSSREQTCSRPRSGVSKREWLRFQRILVIFAMMLRDGKARRDEER